MPALLKLRLFFAAVCLVLFSVGAWKSLDFPALSGIFPLTVSVVGLILATTTIAVDFVVWCRSRQKTVTAEDSDIAFLLESDVKEPFFRATRYGLWLIGFTVFIWLVGFVLAAGVFVLLFQVIESRSRWPALIVGPLATMGLLIVMARILNMYWPEPLISVPGLTG